MNRITGITSTLDGPSAFTYDRNSQLKTASHPTPRAAELYDYDPNGNRIGTAQQVGLNNQTLAEDKYTYQYDAEGNRTRRTAKSASAPEPIEDFTWDHRNRLTKITFRSAAGVETRSIEYRYDLLNRLVLRRLDSNGAATAGGVSDIWLAGYDGINPTLALSSLNSTAVTNRYLWGPGVDFLLADEQLTTTSAPGNTLWPLGDHLGTLRDLADLTGGSFTITNHRVFDTFGRLNSETNASVDTNFAFTGKFFDDLGDAENSTSLSHHWNRWYDPQTGKWMSEDPIGFAGGDANLGRYVGNGATIFLDPSGNVLEHFERIDSDDKYARAADEAILEAIENAGKKLRNWTAENPADKGAFGKAYSDQLRSNPPRVSRGMGTFYSGVLVDLETHEVLELNANQGTRTAVELDFVFTKGRYKLNPGTILDPDQIEVYEFKATEDGRVRPDQLARISEIKKRGTIRNVWTKLVWDRPANRVVTNPKVDEIEKCFRKLKISVGVIGGIVMAGQASEAHGNLMESARTAQVARARGPLDTQPEEMAVVELDVAVKLREFLNAVSGGQAEGVNNIVFYGLVMDIIDRNLGDGDGLLGIR
jgi:RHS repeat-associated protein